MLPVEVEIVSTAKSWSKKQFHVVFFEFVLIAKIVCVLFVGGGGTTSVMPTCNVWKYPSDSVRHQSCWCWLTRNAGCPSSIASFKRCITLKSHHQVVVTAHLKSSLHGLTLKFTFLWTLVAWRWVNWTFILSISDWTGWNKFSDLQMIYKTIFDWSFGKLRYKKDKWETGEVDLLNVWFYREQTTNFENAGPRFILNCCQTVSWDRWKETMAKWNVTVEVENELISCGITDQYEVSGAWVAIERWRVKRF